MRKLKRGFTVVELVMTIGIGGIILFVLAFFGFLAYVALHFLMKVW